MTNLKALILPLIVVAGLIAANTADASNKEDLERAREDRVSFILSPDGTRCITYKDNIDCDFVYGKLLQHVKDLNREIFKLRKKLSKFKGA